MAKNKKILMIIALVFLLAAVLRLIYPLIKPKKPTLVVSGRVEAQEIEVGTKIAGKTRDIKISDGMTVRKGDVLALIEDDELLSKKREMTARDAETAEKIRAAELNLNYSRKNVELTVDEARKAHSIAEARLRQANSRRENAAKDLKRYDSLLEKGAASAQRHENIRLAFQLADEDAKTAGQEVERAAIVLRKAEDARELIQSKESELQALRKSRSQIEEYIRQVEINLGYARITAPIDGVILKKVAEPGEVLSQGGIIGILINPDDIHVKTYVPERYIGMLSTATPVKVVTDAYPDRSLAGSVCFISDKAEFTPKEVQSYEERVKQVFSVKICFPAGKDASSGKESPHQVLKKGMPVDVTFDFSGQKR